MSWFGSKVPLLPLPRLEVRGSLQESIKQPFLHQGLQELRQAEAVLHVVVVAVIVIELARLGLITMVG